LKKKNLTNTFKVKHKSTQNTNKTSYLGVEEFNPPHALSLRIFIYDIVLVIFKTAKNHFPAT
jgi:hypothetical protein